MTTMTLICQVGVNRKVEIDATNDWLRSTFSSRQINRLLEGKDVHKGKRGTAAERRRYWKLTKAKARRRLK